jgi:DNA-binding transcriptional LysR family regulator
MSKLDEIDIFIRVVEANSITAAAEQLGLAKSAVSKRLNRLESQLGVTLLKRTTRSMTLTPAGESYYQQSLKLLADLAEIESSIRSEQTDIAGKIRLSIPFSYGLLRLQPILMQFMLDYPAIQLDVDFNDKQIDLVSEGIDLAIRIADLKDSSLIARRLSSIQMRLCGSSEYFEKYGKPKTLSDLNESHRRVHYSNSPISWLFKNKQAKQVVINLPTTMSSNNGEILVTAASQGMGLVWSPDFICEEAVNKGELIPILENEIQTERLGVYAVYPKDKFLSHRVKVFMDYLKSALN